MKIKLLFVALLFSATSLTAQTLLTARSKPLLGIGASNSYNTFLGLNTGLLTTGTNNLFVGEEAGKSNTSGNYNVFVGQGSGNNFQTGSFNTFLGFNAGSDITGYQGSGNVYIGHMAGANYGSTVNNNRLIVNNSDSRTPLLRGTFGAPTAANLIIYGRTGINASLSTTFTYPSTYTNYGLFVKGGIFTDEVTVGASWADYVFDDSYKLKTLEEVEKYIIENNHLPNVPSASVVESQGINVADMARIQQEKIEELTLYLIDMNKKMDAMKKTIEVLSSGKGE